MDFFKGENGACHFRLRKGGLFHRMYGSLNFQCHAINSCQNYSDISEFLVDNLLKENAIIFNGSKRRQLKFPRLLET